VRGAALLTAAVVAVALVPAAAGVAPDPRLAVFSGDPVGIRGKHFKPGERLVVTFAAGPDLRADPPRWRYRIVFADEVGGFVTRFRDLRMTRCSSYRAGARGSLGSRAFVERTVTCREPAGRTHVGAKPS
jgi:hypothetical protein